MVTKNVTKKQSNSVSKAPQMIPGLEGVKQETLIIPRLKLVQKNSVEIDDGIIKPGEIVNSVTKDILAKKDKPLTLIPIKNSESRLLFKPFDDGGGLLCQSFDAIYGKGDPGGECENCPYSKWTENKKGEQVAPECTDLTNVFCLVRGYDFPIPLTVSFGRTSKGAGKQLINFFYFDAQKAQKSPWNFAYTLSSEFKENVKGNYFQFKVAPGGMAQKDEIKIGETFYRLIQSTQVQIHEDEDERRTEQGNVEKAKKDNSAPEMQEDTTNPFTDEK